jgi:hypothetical protein
MKKMEQYPITRVPSAETMYLPAPTVLLMRHIVRMLAVLLLLGTVSSCSRWGYKFAYNNASFVAEQVVDDYFDLTDEQEDLLEECVDSFIAWHRRHELPKLQLFFQQLGSKLRDGMQVKDAAWAFEQFSGMGRRLAVRLSVDAGRFLKSIQPDQIPYLEKGLKEHNEPYVKLLQMPAAQRSQKRCKKSLKFLTDFTGDLEEEQERQYCRLHASLPDTTRTVHRIRLKSQHELKSLIREGASRKTWQTWLQRKLRGPMYSARGYQKKELLEWLEAVQNMWPQVWKILNQEQRAAIQERMGDYVDLISDLRKNN